MAFTVVSPAAKMQSAFTFDTSAFECQQTAASPTSYRRPDTPQLTLHEYRKFQQSPVISVSPEQDHRRLRRKPSSLDLVGGYPPHPVFTPPNAADDGASLPLAAFSWGPSSSSNARANPLAPRELPPSLLPPQPTTPEVRPTTTSPSLSSTVTTLQSSPAHTPVYRGAAACEQATPHERDQRARPISSKRKFQTFQRAKRFPRRAASSSTQGSEGSGGLWEVYAAVFDPEVDQVEGERGVERATEARDRSEERWRASSTNVQHIPSKTRYVRFADIGDDTSRFGQEKDPTATSTLSLSKFEFPAPPGQDNWGSLRADLNSSEIPSSPTTLHLHGTSFDLVNPHASLVLGVHKIETPAEIDGLLDDYFYQDQDNTNMAPKEFARAGSDSPRMESGSSRRVLYDDASSARQNILNLPAELATPPRAHLGDSSPLNYKSTRIPTDSMGRNPYFLAPSPAQPLVRKNTNPFRNRLQNGSATTVRAGESSAIPSPASNVSDVTVVVRPNRDSVAESEHSEPFPLAISPRGSRAQLPTMNARSGGQRIEAAPPGESVSRGEVNPQASYPENTSSRSVLPRYYQDSQPYGQISSSPAVERGLGDASAARQDFTTSQTYGNTASLLQIGQAFTTPPSPPSSQNEGLYGRDDNTSAWFTEPDTIVSYADTSTFEGPDISLPTMPKRSRQENPVLLSGDWLSGSLGDQSAAQHQQDVLKARSLLSDNTDLQELRSKASLVAPENIEQRGENYLELERLRKENPRAVKEAAIIVAAEKNEEIMRSNTATPVHPEDQVKESGTKLQKTKRVSPFKNPLRSGVMNVMGKGKGRALTRTISTDTDRQPLNRPSAQSLKSAKQSFAGSESSFDIQDAVNGKVPRPDFWNPYEPDSTKRVLEPADLNSNRDSTAPPQIQELDFGIRGPSSSNRVPGRSHGLSQAAIRNQTELRGLRMTLAPSRSPSGGQGRNGREFSRPQNPSGPGSSPLSRMVTTCTGPITPTLARRDPEYGFNCTRMKDHETLSKYYLGICGYFPFMGLLYGLGALDWYIKKRSHGRFTGMAKKQKRDALYIWFPLSTLFWASLITTIIVLGIIARGSVNSEDSTPFAGSNNQ